MSWLDQALLSAPGRDSYRLLVLYRYPATSDRGQSGDASVSKRNPVDPAQFFPITINQPRYRLGPKRSRRWSPQVTPCAHTRDPKTFGEVLLRGIKEGA